jgi:hypothetical protein
MNSVGPTFRPPHAAFAASPLPEEPARHRLRRPCRRARTGEPFLARIAQCVCPFSISAVGVRGVSVIRLHKLVAAQGVAAIMPERRRDGS